MFKIIMIVFVVLLIVLAIAAISIGLYLQYLEHLDRKQARLERRAAGIYTTQKPLYRRNQQRGGK